MPKKYGIQQILDVEECRDIDEFLEIFAIDSVVPAVCTSCGHVTGMEPDCGTVTCEDCNKKTMVGALTLLGMI